MTTAAVTVRRIAATLVLALLCQIGAAAGMHHVPAETQDAQIPHAQQHHAPDGHHAANPAHCGDSAMNPDGGDACGDSAHACPLCAGACGHVIPGGSASCDTPHAGWPRLDRERAGPPAFTASLYRPPNRC